MKGHLRRRGNSWELRAYVGVDPITKRQKYLTRTFRGGKREAEGALARFITEVSGGGHAAQDTTVEHLIRQWLDLARSDLSPSTVRGYERIIESYINPTLGKVPLGRLKTAQLDHFYAELRARGGHDGAPLAPATVRQTHAIIRRALQQGVRWGWIASNPAALASPPRVQVPQLSTPNPVEVIRLIELASSDDADFGCFLHVAATTGARRGELCALRGQNVDLESATMTINRSVVEGMHNVLVEKDTKTHGSRCIALDANTVATLRAQRQRMASRALACGVGLADDAYVFSRDPNGRRPWVPNDVTKGFIRVRNSAGLSKVRLHDLRHFTATRLLAAGVPVRTVSGRLGHANAATTLGVYAHFVEESDRDAADKLGDLLQQRPTANRRFRAATTPR
jgi:integrase